jgi:predicted MFS family arabinose efflux permease
MTAQEIAAPDAADARRNVFLLAVCQALGQTGLTMVIVGAGLVGYSLADDKSLATLPVAVQFTATMLTTIPASFLMKRHGRRAGFMLGAFLGIVGGLVGALAVWRADFALFLAAHALIGAQTSFVHFYRFAAADTATPAFRPKAISLVLAGACVAAVAGPELAKVTRPLFDPVLFAGTYLAIAALQGAAMLILSFLRIPPPTEEERTGTGRPLAVVMRQPTFVVAMTTAAIGYGTMSLVMTATPLAIIACGYGFSDAAFIIQWHALGMFAPSFFTGSLIKRFGTLRIIAAGAVLNAVCLAINLAGVDILNFWSALVLLGIGWNFMFIGATTLLTETYTPAEKAKAQAANDFVVFTVVAVASFLSGALHSGVGWEAVNIGVAPLVAAALGATLWLMVRRRAEAAAAG